MKPSTTKFHGPTYTISAQDSLAALDARIARLQAELNHLKTDRAAFARQSPDTPTTATFNATTQGIRPFTADL